LHGYRGYSQQKFDSKSRLGKTGSNKDRYGMNLRDQNVGPYT